MRTEGQEEKGKNTDIMKDSRHKLGHGPWRANKTNAERSCVGFVPGFPVNKIESSLLTKRHMAILFWREDEISGFIISALGVK